MRNRGHPSAALSAPLLILLAIGGCGEVVNVENEAPPAPLMASERDMVILTPQTSGTIGYFPIWDIIEINPVGSGIQSTYFRTTHENINVRRGCFEYDIPEFQEEILTASLWIYEDSGYSGHPAPPDTHYVSYYAADLLISEEDFWRETVVLGTVITDRNEPPITARFDVSHVIRTYEGENLGFKIQLKDDLDLEFFGWSGSEFGSLNAHPPLLRIRLGSVAGRDPQIMD